MTVRVYVPPTDDQLEPRCSPLCGASKAYGRFDTAWKHESECPVRLAWEAARHRAAQEAAWALLDSTAGGAE